MNPTVLYVDDEPVNLFLFEKIIGTAYNVITAESGRDGLDKLQSNNDITAVISDMAMPVMDGVEFITQVKIDFPNLPCFILSGYSFNEKIEKALNSGLILRFFTKPFEFSKLDAALKAVQ